jgi:hypothetical protein
MASPVMTIDVAHPPRHPDIVEKELLSAMRIAQSSPGIRILKIVHGSGSQGRENPTTTTTRNFLFRNRTKFRAIINGEDYTLFDVATQEMRKVVGSYSDVDLGMANGGITVAWVK